MLTKIKKIKNFGVFGDYTDGAELPNFGRYNVIYGENGAGKTTLSRLIFCLESGRHPDHPNLEFLIESQSGQLTHGSKYARKVRAFNSDYVEANIGRLDGPLRHILILGEENKALAEQLQREIETKESRERQLVDLDASIAKLINDRGKLFSQIAKTIGEATSGSSLRSYRKPDAETAYMTLCAVEPLSQDQLEAHRATVRQDEMPQIGMLGSDAASKWTIDEALEAARNAADRAKELGKRTAQASVIERLVKNPIISAWVEEGLYLHEKLHAGNCEFCLQPLPPERLKALGDHFSLADQELKDEIDAELIKIRAIAGVLNDFSVPDRLALYSELRVDYDKAVGEFEGELTKLKGNLDAVEKALVEKLTMRTTVYEPDITSDSASVSSCLDAIKLVIKRHDEKTSRFDKEKMEARSAIEAHYLLSIKDSENAFATKIKEYRDQIEKFRDGGEGLDDTRSMPELQESIDEKRAKVSSEHAGGGELTENLKQFLGRTDLRFESGPDGYRVLRRGKPAKRLSEGERTAIAFLYFLVQLKDQDFEMPEGIVVIDDPISSLDASAIYQAFSFLKNETQNAKQLFVLTHNFEFLRLLLNWLKNIPGPRADKTYTMVLCSETEQGRFARLVPLDKLLIEHATEYHYLFKVLYSFKSDGTILGCYHIPNIARKVLETFLDFHVPSNKSMYQKLEETNFEPHKKTAIYKFANDLSHRTGKSFDPSLVSETQKNASYLLEMIAAVAPLHYAGLRKLCES